MLGVDGVGSVRVVLAGGAVALPTGALGCGGGRNINTSSDRLASVIPGHLSGRAYQSPTQKT